MKQKKTKVVEQMKQVTQVLDKEGGDNNNNYYNNNVES